MISILAIVILIAVPTFGSVRDRTNQSIYESKIASVKAASEAYSEETGEIAFDVGTLIRQGKLEADNESGEYRNPVNGEDMSCYAVEVRYENLHYYANVHETKSCLTPDELQDLYGIVSIQVFDSEKKPLNQPIHENWYNQPIRLGYRIKDLGIDYEIKQITWVGDQSITCTDGNLDSCEFYGEGTLGAAGTVQTMKASLEMVLELENGAIVRGRAQKQILIDMEGPRVVSIEASPGMTNQSGKRVDIEMTDGNGSGLREYRVVKVANEGAVPVCKDLGGYQSIEQSKMTEYLDNGWYYTCVRDNVSNDNQNTIKQTKKQVTGVDYSKVDGASLTVENQDENTPMKVKAKITFENAEDINKLKMCVSDSGHLKDCSWEAFKSSFDWTFPGHANCVNRTLYVSISDEVGNITDLVNNAYKPHSIAKFDGNGVTLGVADAKKSVCYDGSYSIPTVTRTGYTFNGWYTQTSGGTKLNTDDKVDYDGVRTYYAQWNINNYYLDLNGLLDGTSSGNTNGYGTFDVYINNSKVATGVSDYYTLHPYGTSYEIKNINATTGHTYEGVYEGDLKSNVGKDGKNTNVRLKFKTNSYTVKWDGNNGTVTQSGATSVKYNNSVGTLGTATRKGFVFGGWYTAASGGNQIDKNYKITGNTTFYAHWIDECANVTYKDGTTCSKTCGGGTYNRLAYSSATGARCSTKDQSSGGSACNTQSCYPKTADGTINITFDDLCVSNPNIKIAIADTETSPFRTYEGWYIGTKCYGNSKYLNYSCYDYSAPSYGVLGDWKRPDMFLTTTEEEFCKSDCRTYQGKSYNVGVSWSPIYAYARVVYASKATAYYSDLRATPKSNGNYTVSFKVHLKFNDYQPQNGDTRPQLMYSEEELKNFRPRIMAVLVYGTASEGDDCDSDGHCHGSQSSARCPSLKIYNLPASMF